MPLDVFLYVIEKNQVYHTFALNLLHFNGRLMIFIRTISQKILNYMSIALESRLHEYIEDSGGHFQHQ